MRGNENIKKYQNVIKQFCCEYSGNHIAQWKRYDIMKFCMLLTLLYQLPIEFAPHPFPNYHINSQNIELHNLAWLYWLLNRKETDIAHMIFKDKVF